MDVAADYRDTLHFRSEMEISRASSCLLMVTRARRVASQPSASWFGRAAATVRPSLRGVARRRSPRARAVLVGRVRPERDVRRDPIVVPVRNQIIHAELDPVSSCQRAQFAVRTVAANAEDGLDAQVDT